MSAFTSFTSGQKGSITADNEYLKHSQTYKYLSENKLFLFLVALKKRGE